MPGGLHAGLYCLVYVLYRSLVQTSDYLMHELCEMQRRLDGTSLDVDWFWRGD